MTTIIIYGLPDNMEQRLRLRAAAHGRSVEAEAREISVDALSRPARTTPSWIEQLMVVGDELGGVDLEIPEDRPATFAAFERDPRVS
jgi:plasmid stability protein